MLFELINKYKKIIYTLVDQQALIPNPYQVFQHLLSDYITTNSYSATLLASPHLPFAKSLSNIVKNNAAETINYLNGYLQSNLIRQNASFFGLLIAYFYYYQDYYDLKTYDAIYTQIVLPLHLYSKRMEHDEIDLLIAKTDDPDDDVRSAACKELGNILIPEEKREGIIDKLINKLDDANLWVKVYSCEALGKIAIPDQKRDWVCKTLLGKINLDIINKVACESLGKMTISDEMSDVVIFLLFEKFANCHNATQDVICKALTTIIISESQWKIITDRLLVKADSTDYLVRFAAYNFLGNIPIPKEKYETVVNKLYSHLTMSQHSDFYIHHSVFSNLEGILRKINIPNIKCDSLVNKFLIELDSADMNCRNNAFWLLSRLQLSEDEMNSIIHKMFENDAQPEWEFFIEFLQKKNENFSDSNAVSLIDKIILYINTNGGDSIQALSLIKIPESRFQIVFETLLLQVDEGGYYSDCAGKTLEKIIKKYAPSTIITQIINSILKKIEDGKSVNYFQILGNIPIQSTDLTIVINCLLNKTNHAWGIIRESACDTLSKMNIPGNMVDTVLAKMIGKANDCLGVFIAASTVIKNMMALSDARLEMIIDMLTQDIYIADGYHVLPFMPIPISRRERVFNAMIKRSDCIGDDIDILAALSHMDMCENHREIVIDKLLIQLKRYPFPEKIYESLKNIDIPVKKQQEVIDTLIKKIASYTGDWDKKLACETFIALHQKMSQADCIASLIRLEHQQETILDTQQLPALLKFAQSFRRDIAVNSVLSQIPNDVVKKYGIG